MHDPRLVHCWSMLVIGSVGPMWTLIVFAKSPSTKPNDLVGHRFSRPEGLLQWEFMFINVCHPPKHICQVALCQTRTAKSCWASHYLTIVVYQCTGEFWKVLGPSKNVMRQAMKHIYVIVLIPLILQQSRHTLSQTSYTHTHTHTYTYIYI